MEQGFAVSKPLWYDWVQSLLTALMRDVRNDTEKELIMRSHKIIDEVYPNYDLSVIEFAIAMWIAVYHIQEGMNIGEELELPEEKKDTVIASVKKVFLNDWADEQ